MKKLFGILTLILSSLLCANAGQLLPADHVVTYDSVIKQSILQPSTKVNIAVLNEAEYIQTPLVDNDNDGLDDNWETANKVSDPLADEDNDGFINIIEYQENLDPHVSNSDFSDQVNYRDLLVVTPGWNLVSVPDLATATGVIDFINNKCDSKAWFWDSITTKYKPAGNNLISSKMGYWFFSEKYATIPLERVTATTMLQISTIVYNTGTHGSHTGGGPLTQTNTGGTTIPTITANTGWKFTGWKFQPSTKTGELEAVAQYQRVFSLTVNSGTGSGSILVGDTVNIVANAAPTDKVFDKWTGDVASIADVTQSSTSLVMPAQNVNLTATYKATAFTLTVNSGSGSGSILVGDTVNISANTAPAGKVFDKWTGDVSSVADVTQSSTSLVMPAKSVNLTATYSSVVSAHVDSVSPATAVKNQPVEVTITGTNLPSTLAFTFDHADPVTKINSSATSVTFRCIPTQAGSFSYIVKDKPAGQSLKTGPFIVTMAGDYIAFDLANGTQETFTSSPAGGWGDKYKTTHLLMRRIPKGTFTMGSPTTELGRDSDETAHQVTLTQDYYIGVFELTQAQYKLITGDSSQAGFDSGSSHSFGETQDKMRPMETVSYNDIRGSSLGAGWPANNQVDSSSMLGKLRAKLGGKLFDLPTEAQWEYACRAGTTTALNNGKNLTSEDGTDPELDKVGWYDKNNTPYGTKVVGRKLPNNWGLYDMHGNVWEWCLDRYDSYGSSAVTDPKGSTSGSGRNLRGGGWHNYARDCRSAYRLYYYPSSRYNTYGLRLVLPLGQ